VARVLMAAGILHGLIALQAERRTIALEKAIVGLLYALAALAIVQHPLWSAVIVTIVVSAAMMAEGMLTLLVYFFNVSTSGLTLLHGIVTVTLATIVALGGLDINGR
jgi:uncharacterized membrane protein HdeD (DUF308 family)